MRMPHVVTYKDQIFCFNEIIVQKLMSIFVRKHSRDCKKFAFPIHDVFLARWVAAAKTPIF